MARITSEEAVKAIGNRYDLVLVAAARTKELAAGEKPKLTTNNGHQVTALKEIEQGLYTKAEYLRKMPKRRKKNKDESAYKY
jgi:DNA-directed RNA polymerase subunit omega